jgi:hypothetical protein
MNKHITKLVNIEKTGNLTIQFLPIKRLNLTFLGFEGESFTLTWSNSWRYVRQNSFRALPI